MKNLIFSLVTTLLLLPSTFAGKCSNTIHSPEGIQLTIAPGYEYAVVANNLTIPRAFQIDSFNRLLVVEYRIGVKILTGYNTGDDATCVAFNDTEVLIDDVTLTHGIQLSPDEKTLYVSSEDIVYAYPYSLTSGTVGIPEIAVKGMGIDDGHDTRTILLSSNPPGFIIINRGSKDNISPAASNISDGQAMIKAFSLSSPLSTSSPPPGGWDFKTEGILLGWGLRNNVGLAQHPTTGGIWSVENSADELNRSGTDVHLNNPGDELNYLGTIKAPSGGNYGYPTCFAAWNVSALPENEGIRVGEQFAMDPKEDWKCKASVGPRLTFQAHVAPLDMKFVPSPNSYSGGTEAWISFHGSWNRDPPIGYNIGSIQFSASGELTAPSTSTDAVTYIFRNADVTKCPDLCVRPVGILVDKKYKKGQRVFFTSDQTGEVYVIVRR